VNPNPIVSVTSTTQLCKLKMVLVPMTHQRFKW